MYEYVAGRLVERGPEHVVIDVSGVGWRVAVPATAHQRLPEVGQTATLYTHHLVRDERPVLYGFASREERGLFERLLGVSKVGPAIALALLSALEPSDLAAAITRGDVASLAKVKGVGKRTAERLVVELRDRLDPPAAGSAPGIGGQVAAVTSALMALGYPRAAAQDVARDVTSAGDQDSLETLVKEGLRRLASGQAAAGPPG